MHNYTNSLAKVGYFAFLDLIKRGSQLKFGFIYPNNFVFIFSYSAKVRMQLK